jgi:hypothetical protein
VNKACCWRHCVVLVFVGPSLAVPKAPRPLLFWAGAVSMALLVPPPCGFLSLRCWSPHRQFFASAYTPLVFDSLPIHTCRVPLFVAAFPAQTPLAAHRYLAACPQSSRTSPPCVSAPGLPGFGITDAIFSPLHNSLRTGMCTSTDTSTSLGTIAGISHLVSAGVAALNQIMEWS